jgi:hypothetical protein
MFMVRKQSKVYALIFTIIVVSLLTLFLSSPSLAFTSELSLELNTPSALLSSQPLSCDVTSNSNAGYGAVEICGTIYSCGMSDGVCPEDFFDSSEGDGLQGNCSRCPDPDCLAFAKIKVTNPDNASVGDVIITIEYPSYSSISSILPQTTNITGETSFSIYSGFATVTAQKFGFATQVQEVLFERKNEEDIITFQQFKEASCEADCTRETSNYCDASCDGSNFCTFPTPVVDGLGTIDFKDVCAPPQTNSSKKYVGFVGDLAYFANCCTGNLETQPRFLIDLTKQDLLISGLMNHVQSVRLNGEQIFLVATTFQIEN